MARAQSLQDLRRKIRELQARAAKLKQAAKPGMRELVALLKKYRLGLSDVKIALSVARPVLRRSRSKGRPVKPKYRNPNDASQSWVGQGRMPRWMADLVRKGEKPETFLIKSSSIEGQSARADVPHCATPVASPIASAYPQDLSGAALEVAGSVSRLAGEADVS
jgi:DNA-binding protein H-NS